MFACTRRHSARHALTIHVLTPIWGTIGRFGSLRLQDAVLLRLRIGEYSGRFRRKQACACVLKNFPSTRRVSLSHASSDTIRDAEE